MANHKQALKRHRQDERKRKQNQGFKSAMRTKIKHARAEIQAGEADPTKGLVLEAVKALANASSKGIMHKKTASRRISRLMLAANKSSK